MIKPTIGRVVLLFRRTLTEPIPALVCHVWNDHLINVGGFDGNGVPIAFTSVTLVQGDEERPKSEYWAEWMPYQKAVASGIQAPTMHATPPPVDNDHIAPGSERFGA